MFSENVTVYFNTRNFEQIVYYLRAFPDKMAREVERCVWFILLLCTHRAYTPRNVAVLIRSSKLPMLINNKLLFDIQYLHKHFQNIIQY